MLHTYAIPATDLPHGHVFIHCEPHELPFRIAIWAAVNPEAYRMPRLPIKRTPAEIERRPIMPITRRPYVKGPER
jgi:hypothetical protein